MDYPFMLLDGPGYRVDNNQVALMYGNPESSHIMKSISITCTYYFVYELHSHEFLCWVGKVKDCR